MTSRVAATILYSALLSSFSLVHAGSKEIIPAPVAAPAEDAWQFQIKPYGWLTGLNGSTGVGDFVSDIDIDSMEVLNHLNWAFFLQAEARRGSWGILFDGFYAELSGGGSPPGELYSQSDFTLGQSMAELALAYRLVDAPEGFVDVFAGVRYNGLELDLNAAIRDSGVRKVSEQAASKIIDTVSENARDILAREAARIQSEAATKIAGVKEDITDSIVDKIKDKLPRAILRPTARNFGKIERAGLISNILPEIRELARAQVEARVASLRQDVRSRVSKRVATAEKNLAKALERELKATLPESVSEKKDWVDPFLGLRGQWNISEKFFLASRADIGGFGVGSDLTWQAAASLGYHFNAQWFSEIGYRIVSADYSDGKFIYDVNSSGLFVSLGFNF